MRLKTRLLASFGQSLEEILPVHIIIKDVLPTVPTAHYMVNGAWIFNPYLAWHATNMIIFCSAVKQLV